MKNKLLTVLLTPMFLVLAVSMSLAGYGSYSKSSSIPVKPDIVDTAISAGSFQTLVTALQEAELVQ